MNLFYIYFLISTSYILLTEFFIELCFTNMKLLPSDNNKIINKYNTNCSKIIHNLKRLCPLYIII